MNKYLVTGCNGFIGKHLIKYLNNIEECKIVGLDIHRKSNIENIEYRQADLTERYQVNEFIRMFRPNYIIHLATEASSSMQQWKNPLRPFENNMKMIINILESMKELNTDARLLNIGSGKQYKNDLHVGENGKIENNSVYEISKNAQEQLCLLYQRKYAINIITTRPFNVFGQGQNDVFLIPSLFNQFEYEIGPIVIQNNAIIDFTDIRDAVRAFYLLLHKGNLGEIYNICSGTGISIEGIIELISKLYNRHANVIRKTNDSPALIGSYSKIKIELGWQPEYEIMETLKWIKESYEI